jgi:predicted membrane channel-forming protein YqfA (hemolysin III family)
VNETLAHEAPENEARVTASPAKQDSTAIFIVVAAWIVPGMGHLLLRRWGRAIVFFIAVGGLAITGYLLRGNVFAPRGGDAFGTLGFLADAGSGVFYYLARFFEAAGPDVSRAAGDYGTRFIAAAGVVNLIGVCDAYEIATRRRS